ncbi:MAG: hypothetical protein QMD00_04330 [Hadesarchaea archaeon]|nr:hypothetical protein [Hadesarchaea archaeon]
MGALFAGERPKFTVNAIVVVICVFQAMMLFTQFSFQEFFAFFTSGMPRPAVCGPLLLTWAIVCVLYLANVLKSPKISTVLAAICVYFGTMTLLFFRPEQVGGDMFTFAWATSVHALETYIGYGYFIESAVKKLKLW